MEFLMRIFPSWKFPPGYLSSTSWMIVCARRRVIIWETPLLCQKLRRPLTMLFESLERCLDRSRRLGQRRSSAMLEFHKAEAMQAFVDDAVKKGARVVNAGGGTACETLYFPAVAYPGRDPDNSSSSLIPCQTSSAESTRMLNGNAGRIPCLSRVEKIPQKQRFPLPMPCAASPSARWSRPNRIRKAVTSSKRS